MTISSFEPDWNLIERMIDKISEGDEMVLVRQGKRKEELISLKTIIYKLLGFFLRISTRIELSSLSEDYLLINRRINDLIRVFFINQIEPINIFKDIIIPSPFNIFLFG